MPAFHAPIDLTRNEIRNALFQNLGQPPANPVSGQFYWDTALNRPRIYNASANAGAGGWEDMVGAEGTVTGVAADAPLTSSGGTSPTLSITDATESARGAMTAADKAKLNGVAAGATANATDAQLRDRATHTGTQLSSTISDFDAAAVAAANAGTIDADTLGGQNLTYVRARANHTGTQAPATIAMAATSRLLGRVTAGAGAAEELTAAQVKTLLAYAMGDVTGLTAALAAKQDTSAKDQPNGYAGLDAQGKVAANALPAIAISDTFLVANQAAQLALTAEVGDVAIRTDQNQSYILRVAPASTLANWEVLRSPTDGVTNVTGTAPITSTGGTTPAIGLADLGVTNAKLAANAVTAGKIDPDVAGNGLTGGGGNAIAVNTGTGLEVVSDLVRIAATAAGNGLTGGGGSALAVGAGTGINVAATQVSVDTAVVARKYSADIGATTAQVLTHNLNTRDVQVTVREVASPYAQVYADVEMTTVNTVTVRFATAPAAGAYRATCVG